MKIAGGAGACSAHVPGPQNRPKRRITHESEDVIASLSSAATAAADASDVSKAMLSTIRRRAPLARAAALTIGPPSVRIRALAGPGPAARSVRKLTTTSGA